MRSLLRSERPSTLARALSELGRINKTLYLLPYIDDETYRRRILVQLNRHEGRHALARDTFHGRRGEVRQRYREGQEDQLGALGLVVNAIILWNTLYLETALDHLRAGGAAIKAAIKPEDVARLSPLGHDHINFTTTSISWGGTHSPWPSPWHGENCGRSRYQISRRKRVRPLSVRFRSNDCQTPMTTYLRRSAADVPLDQPCTSHPAFVL